MAGGDQFGHTARRRGFVVIDGLLGIGASGPLRKDIRGLAQEINIWRSHDDARVWAIDLPTGLDGDTGKADPDCVVADVTVTAGFAKAGLVVDGAAAYVGRLAVAPLAEFEPHAPKKFTGQTATPDSLRGLLPRRNFESYKTQYGRVGIVAGSPRIHRGGRALLEWRAARRRGPGDAICDRGYPADPRGRPRRRRSWCVRSKATRKCSMKSTTCWPWDPASARGTRARSCTWSSMRNVPWSSTRTPSTWSPKHDPGLLRRCAGPRLLTPHPGEMARLFPESRELSRYRAVMRFAAQLRESALPGDAAAEGLAHDHPRPGKPASYNTTGTPAMGTGGMGDVLTGVCAALIGQHLSPYDAARVGAWLCGRSAEIGVRMRAEESLAAMDVVKYLGAAFRLLRGEPFEVNG